MKIAYVVPYVPNLIRTRPYNLIVQLVSLGHEVEVYTLGSNRQDLIDAQALETKCSAVRYHVQPVWRSLLNSAVTVPSRQPLQSVYSWQAGMARELAGHVSRKEFDIVHVEHLRGSRYGVFIKSKFPSMPVVWDSVDCISYLFQQAAGQSSSFFGKFVTRFELLRTRKAEGNLIRSFDHVLVTSSTDKKALLELAPNRGEPSPISVLPNGVDLDYFHPNPDIQRDKATIVFSGKMSYHANISMVKYLVSEIMPRVWNSCPEAQLFIVGKDPPPDIKILEKHPLVTVTGTVKDIRPYLWRATVSIVPLLYGAGIQNKILEAMATGTPVVTTSRTLSALEVQPGKDLMVANNADEFAQNILKLINERNLKHAIGDSGLAYVRSKHDWISIATQLASIYQCSLDKRAVLSK
jgi:glycosyltransferase involved in cell wall biosynthesis